MRKWAAMLTVLGVLSPFPAWAIDITEISGVPIAGMPITNDPMFNIFFTIMVIFGLLSFLIAAGAKVLSRS